MLYKLVEVLNAQWEDTIEAAIDAAMAGATLGELAKTLRTGDEVATTIEPVRPYRASEAFESLRVANEVYESRTGLPPQVFLANMGPISQHKARADFVADCFQAGGFQIISNDGFSTVRAATRAAIDSGAPVIVICSTDETYPGLVPRLTRTVKRACPGTIVMLAGQPAADQEKTYRKAGVDDFIHVGADLFDKLLNLQQKLGIV